MVRSDLSQPSPWREAFLEHTAQMRPACFSLSTLHRSPEGATTPRARTCVFRGLWADLPDNEKNPAPRNPHAYESDLPVFTTDARMAKVEDLLFSCEDGGGAAGSTGGGGAVEAVWWAEQAQTQWRVRGTVWVLGPDVEEASGMRAREAIRPRMRSVPNPTGGDGAAGWSWATEVTAHFGNLSPMMRGTFRNPPPGAPRAIPGKEGEGLGQRVDDLDDRLARKNFRVCVLIPKAVDRVDLSRPDDPRRWLYTFVGATGATSQTGGHVSGEWEVCEMWP